MVPGGEQYPQANVTQEQEPGGEPPQSSRHHQRGDEVGSDERVISDVAAQPAKDRHVGQHGDEPRHPRV